MFLSKMPMVDRVAILYSQRIILYLLFIVSTLLSSLVEAKAKPDDVAETIVGIVDELARQHFENGVSLYKNNLFDAARVEFEASYRLCKEPELLINLSHTAEKQGKLRDALDYAVQFLEVQRGKLSEAEQDQVQVRIDRLKLLSAPSTPKAAPRLSGRKQAGIALLAVGGGIVLAGIGCGVGALLQNAALRDGTPRYRSDYDARVSLGNALNAAAIGLDVLGGAVAVAGVILLALPTSQSDRRVTP